jgi:RND family efflux transporter MFP subunit
MPKHFFPAALTLLSIFGLAADLEAAEAAPVDVVSPTLGTEAPSYRFTGTLSARQRAQLSPRLSGLVQTADLEVGDHFEAGQTILQLDPTLAGIELGLREVDVALAETELADAERLLEEANQLGDSGFPRSERLTRANNLKQAEVRLMRAKAELQEQAERVRRHKVLAPFPGIIARKLTEVGEWVETGTPVAELVGDDLRLEVSVPQERILEARNTETVDIRIQGLPEQSIRGFVEALAPVVEPGSRTFLVRIGIEEPPPLLKAGMSAVAVLRPAPTGQSLLIPRDAIIRNEAGETLVWTLETTSNESVARPTPVTLGPSRGPQTIVLSGLSQTSQVVVRGNEGLRDGQVVRIVNASADNADSETPAD